MFSLPLCERGSMMKQPVTDRDKPRWGEMNLQTNPPENIAPKPRRMRKSGRWKAGRKVLIYLMYLLCAYKLYVPQSSKHAEEYRDTQGFIWSEMRRGCTDLNERGQVQPQIGRMVNEQVKKKRPSNERCDVQVENPRADECSSHPGWCPSWPKHVNSHMMLICNDGLYLTPIPTGPWCHSCMTQELVFFFFFLLIFPFPTAATSLNWTDGP